MLRGSSQGQPVLKMSATELHACRGLFCYLHTTLQALQLSFNAVQYHQLDIFRLANKSCCRLELAVRAVTEAATRSLSMLSTALIVGILSSTTAPSHLQWAHLAHCPHPACTASHSLLACFWWSTPHPLAPALPPMRCSWGGVPPAGAQRNVAFIQTMLLWQHRTHRARHASSDLRRARSARLERQAEECL